MSSVRLWTIGGSNVHSTEFLLLALADLRRWGMLDPALVARTGKSPGLHGTPQMGSTSWGIAKPRGLLLLKRHGTAWKLFIPPNFSPTRFGGWRAWFRCPGCWQACRVLYGTNSLHCRKCRGLKYQSQYDSPTFRLLNRAHKLRSRLRTPGSPAKKCCDWRAMGWAAMSARAGAISRKIRQK
jgi:hypothetical protein